MKLLPCGQLLQELLIMLLVYLKQFDYEIKFLLYPLQLVRLLTKSSTVELNCTTNCSTFYIIEGETTLAIHVSTVCHSYNFIIKIAYYATHRRVTHGWFLLDARYRFQSNYIPVWCHSEFHVSFFPVYFVIVNLKLWQIKTAIATNKHRHLVDKYKNPLGQMWRKFLCEYFQNIWCRWKRR